MRRSNQTRRERDALKAALTFYALQTNYEPVRIPDELVPDGERVVVSYVNDSGERVEEPAESFQSGPAVDGGAHARYVLGLLAAGKLT